MVEFGTIWTSRTITAVIIGLTIISIGLVAVTEGFNNIDEHRGETDIRRITTMLEAVDHKTGAVVRLNFVQSYDIELSEDTVTLRGIPAPKRKNINLHSAIDTGTLNNVKYVCISRDNKTIGISQNCEIPRTPPTKSFADRYTFPETFGGLTS